MSHIEILISSSSNIILVCNHYFTFCVLINLRKSARSAGILLTVYLTGSTILSIAPISHHTPSLVEALLRAKDDLIYILDGILPARADCHDYPGPDWDPV